MVENRMPLVSSHTQEGRGQLPEAKADFETALAMQVIEVTLMWHGIAGIGERDFWGEAFELPL